MRKSPAAPWPSFHRVSRSNPPITARGAGDLSRVSPSSENQPAANPLAGNASPRENAPTPAVNPYATPVDAIVAPGNRGRLSAVERRLLTAYMKYREQSPRLAQLIGQSMPGWGAVILLEIALLLVLTLFFGVEAIQPAVLLLVGITIGMISRDVGILRRFQHIWPLFHDLLNWERVEIVLAEDRAEREVNAPS